MAALALCALVASATVIHVPGEQPTIAAGIAAAPPGDTVEIACDTYSEQNLLVTEGITIRSDTGDPSCSAIDGGGIDRILWLGGPAVACVEGATVTAFTCDVYGNGLNWVDCLAGQEVQRDNMELDPLFCDILAGDISLCESSPCLPESDPSGLLIGIDGMGCGPCDSPTEARSWGAIKAMFGTD